MNLLAQGKWTNKERVLIFSSRGINFRTRHLMSDLKTMMPHSKAGWYRLYSIFFLNYHLFSQRERGSVGVCFNSTNIKKKKKNISRCPLDTKMDRKDKLFVINEVSVYIF